MKRKKVLAWFFLGVLLVSVPAQAQTVRREVVVPPDGKPVFYMEEVSNFLLNFPDYYVSWGGNRSRLVSFPASSDLRVQASEQANNPQLILEAFNMAFQGKAHVRNLNNRVQKTQQGFQLGYRRQAVAEPVTVLGYPVADIKHEAVWFPIVSGKILETQDYIDQGSTRKASIWSMILGGVALGLAYGSDSAVAQAGASTAASAALVLSAYRERRISSFKQFSVTVQFRNSYSGDIVTFEGRTRQLMPVVEERFVFYYNAMSGSVQRISMQDAIREAMSGVATQFFDWIAIKDSQEDFERRIVAVFNGDDMTPVEARVLEVLRKQNRGETLTSTEQEIARRAKALMGEISAEEREKFDREVLEYLAAVKDEIQ